MTYKVAVIVGSLRRDSINRKFAEALEKLAEGKLAFDYVEIGDLPHYNDDLWQDGVGPDPVERMKRQIDGADAVLVLVPEFNRSIPGVVANAFDWGSRPWGKSSWAGKPAALTGMTPGATGTAAAQQHLRLQLINLGCIVMHQPEMYMTWTPERFGNGEVKSEDTRKILADYIDAFTRWIERVK